MCNSCSPPYPTCLPLPRSVSIKPQWAASNTHPQSPGPVGTCLGHHWVRLLHVLGGDLEATAIISRAARQKDKPCSGLTVPGALEAWRAKTGVQDDATTGISTLLSSCCLLRNLCTSDMATAPARGEAACLSVRTKWTCHTSGPQKTSQSPL